MKKSELKTGMIVETRAGKMGTIILNFSDWGDCLIFSGNNWTRLNQFHKDTLKWYPFGSKNEGERTEHARGVDIVKVYMPSLPTGIFNQDQGKGKLIWEYEEPIIKTYSISQKFNSNSGKLILARVELKRVCLISLLSGNRANNPITVGNLFEITEEEFNIISESCGIID